jgi:hypothetical protein
MSQNNNAPAKKATLSPIIPVALLLIGLVIMSVCYFNVNGRLNTALEEKFAAEQALAAANTALQNVPEDKSADLVAAEEALAAKEAELTAANEVVAEMDLALTTANEALAAKEAELAETTAALDTALATLDQVKELLNGLGAEQ